MFTAATRLFSIGTLSRHTKTYVLNNSRTLNKQHICPGVVYRKPSRLLSTRWILAATGDLVSAIKEKNTQSKVVVYSRSWCPFCIEVKKLFASYNVDAKVIELDNIVEGDDIQDALTGMTGSSTVPQVFIDGAFIGGCDDTYALDNQGKLKSLLDA